MAAHPAQGAGIIMKYNWIVTFLLMAIPSFAGERAPDPAAAPIFNGRDLDGWYVYTVQKQNENPGIFTVVDGMLRVSGGEGDEAYYGGLITKQEYSNYRLTFEYKWGEPTYGKRKGKARDSGVLLHCVGPNGPGPWMTSYEFQIIEGGTGDILVVDTRTNKLESAAAPLSLVSEGFADGKQRYFKAGGEKLEFVNSGRLNWWGRDPAWTDTTRFRGGKDVESPFGEWTRCEVIARGDTLEYRVNDQLVNRAHKLSFTRGKLLFQTEGAEVWYRNIKLTPLK
ncbi:MAG TPA: DUF1080 domain-containing protein [Verrucomicrobiae bacterium]|nr:DUF1080 domain-containing protein [Verrucomicrobiae bacterium]